jgi:hypothetical protein
VHPGLKILVEQCVALEGTPTCSCEACSAYRGRRPLLGAPRTDPDGPNSGIRLLPRVFDVKAHVGPRVRRPGLVAGLDDVAAMGEAIEERGRDAISSPRFQPQASFVATRSIFRD